MIVPSMTLEEIRKEIEKDYPILHRKATYVAHDLIRELSKAQKEKAGIYFFDYYSKYKNHWIYKIEITKKQTFYTYVLLYHNGRGYMALFVAMKYEKEIDPERMIIIFHTGHFFDRYNERLKLGLKTIREIIPIYMNENNKYDIKELEEIEPGVVTMFCLIESGAVLGTYNRHLKLIKANTFLPLDMLSRNQLELKAALKLQMEKYKHSSASLH